MFSKPVQATLGITAGSGFATTELRVLLIDLMGAITRRWPVEPKLYVDDLTIAAKGTPQYVADTVAKATDLAVGYFRDLGLEVSVKESVAVASNKAIPKRMVKRTETMRLKAVRSTKLLGVGFSGGRRRTTAT